MSIQNERLYYSNSYQTEFTSVVAETMQSQAEVLVRLRDTAFYPTSGGQPHDTGELNGVAVRDVRIEDGYIWHVVERPIGDVGSTVHGRIDWERRFDHMQQHSAQHILSRAFQLELLVDTASFHLGEDLCTIDLDSERLNQEELSRVEDFANAIVMENREIEAAFVDCADLSELNLTKVPAVARDIRIVKIADYEDNPCGGTHPRSTGEVGLISILKSERVKRQTRITFVAGRRAMRVMQSLVRQARDMSELLSAPMLQLGASLGEMVKDRHHLQNSQAQWKKQAVEEYVHRLVSEANVYGGHHVVVASTPDWMPSDSLGDAASALLASLGTSSTVVFIKSDDSRVRVAVGCTKELAATHSAKDMLVQLFAEHGIRGGGSSIFAQGVVHQDQTLEKLCEDSLNRLHSIFSEREMETT